jgi:PD-(D/E)XK nuclease superfamily protein
VPHHLPPPPNGPSAHPVDIGDRTEAIIVAELVRRGYRVLRPLSANQRYDLVLDLGDRFLRVQCKTGRLRNGAIVFSMRSCRSDTKRTYVRSYSCEEADVFLVHCPETDRIYAVAVGDSGVLNTASLRVDAPANNQLKGIRWAVDHELPA